MLCLWIAYKKNLFQHFTLKISSENSRVKLNDIILWRTSPPTPLSVLMLNGRRRGKEEIEFCEYVDSTSSCNKFWLIFDNLFHAFGDDDERRELNALKEIYIIFHAMDFIAFFPAHSCPWGESKMKNGKSWWSWL